MFRITAYDDKKRYLKIIEEQLEKITMFLSYVSFNHN